MISQTTPNVALDDIVAMRYMVFVKTITYSKAAIKVLRRMPNNTAISIRAKVQQYAADPASLANNVKTLVGRPGIRLRVGDWRVIMEDGKVLAVIEIGPRGSIYE